MTTSQEDKELKKIRGLLFPAIGIQIITGFNLYPAKENSKECSLDSNGKIIRISYLHEDLLEDRLHYMRIKGMLEKYSDQIKTQRIKHEAISRFSSYRLEEGWRADEYFLVDQTPVRKEDIDDLIREDITVIGCGLQNELIIECEKDALEYILEQFRLYANAYEIDHNIGKYVLIPGTNEKKPNPHETWDKAWEIPYIIVRAEGIDRVKTYDKVRKISFQSGNEIASLIIGNKWDTPYAMDESKSLVVPPFGYYLALRNFIPDNINNNYFANRVFVDWINKINWEKVMKTKESYGDIFKDLL